MRLEQWINNRYSFKNRIKLSINLTTRQSNVLDCEDRENPTLFQFPRQGGCTTIVVLKALKELIDNKMDVTIVTSTLTARIYMMHVIKDTMKSLGIEKLIRNKDNHKHEIQINDNYIRLTTIDSSRKVGLRGLLIADVNFMDVKDMGLIYRTNKKTLDLTIFCCSC